MTAKPRYEQHEHRYVSGNRPHVKHAHEGGERPHQHAEMGPAAYTGRKEASRARPTGPQFPTVELEDAQRMFRVVFVDRYTTEHERNGTTPERFAAQREDFRALMAGEDEADDGVVARMVGTFRMTPIYEIETPEATDGQ
jgi:hypothetical protein